MRIIFNLYTTLEIPDADKIHTIDEVEKAFTEIFNGEGAIIHSLSITNFSAVVGTTEKED